MRRKIPKDGGVTRARTGAGLRKQLAAERDDWGADGHALLDVVQQSYDISQKAAALLRKHGLVVETEHGSKAHPAIAILQNAQTKLLRALRALDL